MSNKRTHNTRIVSFFAHRWPQACYLLAIMLQCVTLRRKSKVVLQYTLKF